MVAWGGTRAYMWGGPAKIKIWEWQLLPETMVTIAQSLSIMATVNLLPPLPLGSPSTDVTSVKKVPFGRQTTKVLSGVKTKNGRSQQKNKNPKGDSRDSFKEENIDPAK